MRVEVKLNAGEFSVYDVKNNTSINFALRPLRTVISFAEVFNLVIGLNFDSGGRWVYKHLVGMVSATLYFRPLTLSMKHPTFDINFIVSTLNPSKDVQSTISSTSLPMSTQRNNNLNISIEDQQALDSENWDDVMCSQTENNSLVSMINRPGSTRSTINEVFRSEKHITEQIGSHKKVDGKDEDVNYEDIREFSQSGCSQRSKRIKLVFGRCFEPTIVEPDLGKEYLGNSDSEWYWLRNVN